MRIHMIVATAAATLSLVACTSDDNTGIAAETSASTPAADDQEPSTSGNDGETIPDGSYRHVLTSADLKRYGLPRQDDWAPNDTLVVVHSFAGDQWAQSSNYYGDALAVGSSGSLTYAEGRLILDEPSDGKSGYEWSIKGDRLTITPDVEWSAAHNPEFDPRTQGTKIWQLMTAGTYKQVG